MVSPFPPAGLHDLAGVFKPVADGGRLPRSGLVDIAASQEPDGREVFNNIRYGVFVTFKANNEYTRDCFKQYGLWSTSPAGTARCGGLSTLIGLETSVSVLSAVLRNEPTGTPNRVPRRRGRHRQEGPPGRRDAGRRGRLCRLGKCDPGREEPRRRGTAHRPRPQCPPKALGREGYAWYRVRMSNWIATSMSWRYDGKWKRRRVAVRRRRPPDTVPFQMAACDIIFWWHAA